MSHVLPSLHHCDTQLSQLYARRMGLPQFHSSQSLCKQYLPRKSPLKMKRRSCGWQFRCTLVCCLPFCRYSNYVWQNACQAGTDTVSFIYLIKLPIKHRLYRPTQVLALLFSRWCCILRSKGRVKKKSREFVTLVSFHPTTMRILFHILRQLF